MRERGRYAKGVAKRDEILTVALDVVARVGYGKATVREIAAAAGISPTGLLHHFDSKEVLFAEILRNRDEVDAKAVHTGAPEESSVSAVFPEIIRRNTRVPGLVQLYTRLNAEATDPHHPAHAYFRARYERLRESLADGVRRDQDGGLLPSSLDPDQTAVMLIAVADGLQSQWLHDRDLDMCAQIDAIFRGLRRSGEGAGTDHPLPARQSSATTPDGAS